MTTVSGLVSVLHQIAALQEICVSCRFAIRKGEGVWCRKGYKPEGLDDGCDDWQPRPGPERKVA